jgi:uncharacterized repeat protein (TIGR01451 family)
LYFTNGVSNPHLYSMFKNGTTYLRLRRFIWCFLGLVFLTLQQEATAQGWVRYLDESNSYWPCDALAIPNGGVATLAKSGYDTLILRNWDTDGQLLWQKKWNLQTQQYSAQFHLVDNQFITVISANHMLNAVEPFAAQFGLSGDSIKTKILPELAGGYIQSAKRPGGGFFVLLGKTDSIVLFRYNAQMNLESRVARAFQSLGSSTDISSMDVTATSICFSWRNIGIGFTYGLSSLNHTGGLNWTQNFPAPNLNYVVAVKAAPSGGYFCMHHAPSVLHKINESGLDIWQKPTNITATYESMTATTDGGALMAINNFSTKLTTYIRCDAAGNTIWQVSNNFQVGDEWTKGLAEATDGSFFEISRSYFSALANPFVTRLMKFSGTGTFHLATVQGHVFEDSNADCQLASGEKGLIGWIVSAKKVGQNQITYTVTDSAGAYAFSLDTGTYLLQFRLPNNYWQSDCVPLAQAIALPTTTDTITSDLPLSKGALCPLMEVDLATAFLRRCFESSYTVQYSNNGTIDAPNAWIDVQLDPDLSYVSSSLSAISLPENTYRFALGAVPYGSVGSFHMQVLVGCDSTALGQTHCSEAHIYPDTLCLPNTGWSGAEVEVDGLCAPDSVRFTIKNVGTAATSLLDYIIIQDDLILRTGNYTLPPNDSIKIAVPANGATYRLESEQEPNAPGNAQPSATIEGCGTNASGGMSLGFVTQFGENDGDPFISIDCTQNQGSFDPNDKQGFPIGAGAEHHILPGQEIEYLIRFQNTGTDTAFRVVIRDTLSPWLDPASIRVGAASHPMQFSLLEYGILKFDFSNILLPDSNINEAASHGFVKFRIAQIPNIPLGTTIFNQAGIYFDFNDPVITNQTWHTVDTGFLNQISSVIESDANTLIISRLEIAPNPAKGFAQAIWKPTFDAQDAVCYRLIDMFGREIEQGNMQQNTCMIRRNQLPTGLYLLELRDVIGKRLAVEKVIFE